MKKYSFVFIGFFILLAGCATNRGPSLTPLEIQSIQTREYEAPRNVVFVSTISVFQDLGYTVKSADKDTGFITAESAAKSDTTSKIWLGVSKVSQTLATAFVEKIGKVTKVRLNFVTSNTSSSSYGQTDRQDTPVLNAKIYQNAFERIESAIFIRGATQQD